MVGLDSDLALYPAVENTKLPSKWFVWAVSKPGMYFCWERFRPTIISTAYFSHYVLVTYVGRHSKEAQSSFVYEQPLIVFMKYGFHFKFEYFPAPRKKNMYLDFIMSNINMNFHLFIHLNYYFGAVHNIRIVLQIKISQGGYFLLQ